MSMHRVMVVESQSELRSLMISALKTRCQVTPVGDARTAERALHRDAFHAVIINMEIPSADPLALARQAAACGCGTILIPDLPSQFNAAAQAGHLTLGKPFRYQRGMSRRCRFNHAGGPSLPRAPCITVLLSSPP